MDTCVYFIMDKLILLRYDRYVGPATILLIVDLLQTPPCFL